MPNNWFLTGKPGVGKSTIIGKLAETFQHEGYTIGGVISPEVRSADGERLGFLIRDLLTGREETMAHKEGESSMRVGPYRVMMHSIDGLCSEAFPYAFQKADAILVDEIGPMELYSQGFKHYIKEALQQPMPLVGVIHQKTRSAFVRELRKQSQTDPWPVTEENRNALPQTLYHALKPLLRG